MNNYWNKLYKEKKHISVWPWSDIVSEINKIKVKKKIDILEIGCGAGANIPFFLDKRFKYQGVDTSVHIIKILKKKFPILNKKLIASNFKKIDYKKNSFDIIFDRAAVSHNKFDNIQQIINDAYDLLNEEGHYVGVDWYSTKCSDCKKQNKKQTNLLKSGVFKSVGPVFFFKKENIISIFKNFKIISLVEKTEFDHLTKKTFARWRFVAKQR